MSNSGPNPDTGTRFACGYVTAPEDRPALPYNKTRAYLHFGWFALESLAYGTVTQSVDVAGLEVRSEWAGPAMFCALILAVVSSAAALVLIGWMCRNQDAMSLDDYLIWFWARVGLLPVVVTLFATVYWFGESPFWAALLAIASLAAMIAIIADTWCILTAERRAYAAEKDERVRGRHA